MRPLLVSAPVGGKDVAPTELHGPHPVADRPSPLDVLGRLANKLGAEPCGKGRPWKEPLGHDSAPAVPAPKGRKEASIPLWFEGCDGLQADVAPVRRTTGLVW